MAQLLLSAFVKISDLQAARTHKQIPSLHTFPPVFSTQLMILRHCQFSDMLAAQNDHLCQTRGSAHFVVLEDQFCALKSLLSCRSSAKQEVQKRERCVTVGDGLLRRARAQLSRHFGHVVDFLGVLATVLPVTAPEGSNFSVLQLKN